MSEADSGATAGFPDAETELAFLEHLGSAWPLWRQNVGSIKWHDMRRAFIAGCAIPTSSQARIAELEEHIRGLETESTVLKKALNVAVNMVMESEPGDSRAVSAEAVALAAISCGLPPTPDVLQVIDAALRSRP